MHWFTPLSIGVLVIAEVALWQWRMVIAHRGRRIFAMLLGFVGAVLQITAITQVVTDIRDIFGVLAYAAGVGGGVLLGILAGDRLTPGRLEVKILSIRSELPELLWRCGWPALTYEALGRSGVVIMVQVTIDRREEPRLRADVIRLDKEAHWTATELRNATPVHGAPKRSVTRGHLRKMAHDSPDMEAFASAMQSEATAEAIQHGEVVPETLVTLVTLLEE